MDDWEIALSKDWDVLGPFPIHAREQHFIAPCFPIDLSRPVDWQATWPSSYVDGATVQWSKAQLEEDGALRISFPQVRWEHLRQTEGWAALQHHAVLRGKITLIPPRATSAVPPPFRLLLQLKRASYFTILPPNATECGFSFPEWRAGNIYDMERALPAAVDLPTAPDPTCPTAYEIFISGDYEIRLFGDPRAQGTETPVQVISLSAEIERIKETILHEPSQDVLCDFYDGYSFGNAFGVGVRNATKNEWIVTGITSRHSEVQFKLEQPVRIAPSQLRVVPLALVQGEPFFESQLRVEITAIIRSGPEHHLSVSLPIVHHAAQSLVHTAIKATYFFANTMPTAFLAIPPTGQSEKSYSPILALHGAGVDIADQPFWSQSLPSSDLSWTILPSGRTSWGLDWHGPSAQDAWGCVDALSETLGNFPLWKDTAFNRDTPVILIGHSNGGQGTLYLSSRYSDRVLAAVPAAGYIKSQAYVPLTMSRSAHFIDPTLRAILETSLTPDDNDLFLTNLLGTPVLVIHGGDDDNVPVWHGRESINILKSWSIIHGVVPSVIFKEDKGYGHWYPTVFDNTQVRDFINGHLKQCDNPDPSLSLEPFTLTVFRPEESGTLKGWKVEEVKCPGRLARLTITPSQSHGTLVVRTNNVKRFSVLQIPDSFSAVRIDGHDILLDLARNSTLHFERASSTHEWVLLSAEPMSLPSPPTRLQSFLLGKGPITFILPTSTQQTTNYVSLGFRLAHDLHIYHRLDAELVYDYEVFDQEDSIHWPQHNFVVIGKLQDVLVLYLLQQNKTPLGLRGEKLVLNGHPVRTHSDTGMIFLHPHPVSADGLVLFIIGEGPGALERAARLFPMRTGVPAPSWLILDSTVDILGAAGISGAGVWGPAWSWNEAFSWSGYL